MILLLKLIDVLINQNSIFKLNYVSYKFKYISQLLKTLKENPFNL